MDRDRRPSTCAPDLRKFLFVQRVAVAKHRRPEDRVFELPDVSRPVIGASAWQAPAAEMPSDATAWHLPEAPRHEMA